MAPKEAASIGDVSLPPERARLLRADARRHAHGARRPRGQPFLPPRDEDLRQVRDHTQINVNCP